MPETMSDEDINECDCPDKVPADLGPDDFWICPKCDAEWHGDDDA